MIRYSHAMTCLMAHNDKKRTEAISIVLQAIDKLRLITIFKSEVFPSVTYWTILVKSLPIPGEYTGSIGGYGASHEHLNHKHTHD